MDKKTVALCEYCKAPLTKQEIENGDAIKRIHGITLYLCTSCMNKWKVSLTERKPIA